MDSFITIILLFLAVISGFIIGFIADDFVIAVDSSDDCVVNCLNSFNNSYSYDVEGLVNGLDPVLHCDYVCGSYSH